MLQSIVLLRQILQIYIVIWLFYWFLSFNSNFKATIFGAIIEDTVKCCCYQNHYIKVRLTGRYVTSTSTGEKVAGWKVHE